MKDKDLMKEINNGVVVCHVRLINDEVKVIVDNDCFRSKINYFLNHYKPYNHFFEIWDFFVKEQPISRENYTDEEQKKMYNDFEKYSEKNR